MCLQVIVPHFRKLAKRVFEIFLRNFKKKRSGASSVRKIRPSRQKSVRNTRSTNGLSVRKYKTAVKNTARNTYSRNCPCPAVSAKDKNEAVSSSPNSASAAKPVCGKSRRSARSRSYARHSPSPRSTPCAKVSACAETGISISRTAGRKSRRAEYHPHTRSHRRSHRPKPARRR